MKSALIIEDNSAMLRGLKDNFESKGFRVRTARDGEQGLAAALTENPDLVIPEAPAGIPFVYEEHVEMMYDLLSLAYEADITRVFTFMMAREISNRTYPQVGVSEGHHAVSHHANRPEKIEWNARIQGYHVSLFTKFLEKLDSTPDGDGSLLDNSLLLYGSNMSNSNAHDHFPLPNALVGGARGRHNGGQHIKAVDHTPMTNLLLTMLQAAGVETVWSVPDWRRRRFRDSVTLLRSGLKDPPGPPIRSPGGGECSPRAYPPWSNALARDTPTGRSPRSQRSTHDASGHQYQRRVPERAA